VWVDTSGEEGKDVLRMFKDYFENKEIRKVYHNFCYDYLVLRSHIEGCVPTMHADTLHMAKLLDISSLSGYDLTSLSRKYELPTQKENGIMHHFNIESRKKNQNIFRDLQIYEHDKWVEYCLNDTKVTLELYLKLKEKLQGPDCEWINMERDSNSNMWEFYQSYYRKFGVCLANMQWRGVCLDPKLLEEPRKQGNEEYENEKQKFLDWVTILVGADEAEKININSPIQLRQVFFRELGVSSENILKTDSGLESVSKEQLKSLRQRALIPDAIERLRYKHRQLVEELAANEGFNFLIKEMQSILRVDMWEYNENDIKEFLFPRLLEEKWRNLEDLSVQDIAIKVQSDYESYCRIKCADYDTLRDTYKDAIDGLNNAKNIHKLLSTYINKLPSYVNPVTGRIHANFKLGPGTGRLSCSNPNLQNQPSANDKYNIRNAFVPEKGKAFIIADYSQLELRVLAYVSKCEAMLKAFKLGGDFHSRTAADMFPEVRESVERGEVVIDYPQNGIPTVKDKFPKYRSHAKQLNFAVAYGAGAYSLKNDLGISLNEAEAVIQRWYNSRPEVRTWQAEEKKYVIQTGKSYTFMGRYRPLWNREHDRERIPEDLEKTLLKFEGDKIEDAYHTLLNRHRKFGTHNGNFKDLMPSKEFGGIMRQAVNTPIQGGASDLVMSSMLNLENNKKLKELKWELLLNIHDEVVLEGPINSQYEALKIVKNIMEHKEDVECKVDTYTINFPTDAKVAEYWE